MTPEYSTMDEIILNPKGNTYVGPLANRFVCELKLPEIFHLSSGDCFHVFEVTEGKVIHRASQSSFSGARSYMNPSRVLVYRHDAPAS